MSIYKGDQKVLQDVLDLTNLQPELDKKANVTDLTAHATAQVNSETGVHNFRYFNNNLQVFDGTAWVTIEIAQDVVIDDTLSETSVNPVQNKVVNEAITTAKTDTLASAKSYTDDQISKINITSFKVVDTLPATGIDTTAIYLVAKITAAGEDDVYDEYIYVNGKYEHLGTTTIDLSNYYNKTETDTAIDTAIDTALAGYYIFKGSVTIANLPEPVANNVGYVYNIVEDFTTTENFIEGANKSYKAGTNVVIVKFDEGVYKYDIFSGNIDLTNYYNKTETDNAIATHNIDETAHSFIQNKIGEVADRVFALEVASGSEVTANPFIVTYGGLEGTISNGIWDEANMRLGF